MVRKSSIITCILIVISACTQNNKKETELQKIIQWKWMVGGGMVVLAWVISNVNLAALSKIFN